MSITYSPWLQLHNSLSYLHQLRFLILTSQTKPNKWINSLPSSLLSLVLSLYPYFCLPHLLIPYPSAPPNPFSPWPLSSPPQPLSLSQATSEELIHLQNSPDTTCHHRTTLALFSKHGSYFVKGNNMFWRNFQIFRGHLVHFAALQHSYGHWIPRGRIFLFMEFQDSTLDVLWQPTPGPWLSGNHNWRNKYCL